jgi:hypothetical protein
LHSHHQLMGYGGEVLGLTQIYFIGREPGPVIKTSMSMKWRTDRRYLKEDLRLLRHLYWPRWLKSRKCGDLPATSVRMA